MSRSTRRSRRCRSGSSDVAPDGTSAQVSAGVLNLTHRRSHADPEPLHARGRRGGPRPAADRRLSMAAGSPAPRRARVVAVAGPLAVAVSRDVPAPSRAGARRRGSSCRSSRRPAADGDAPVPAFRTEPPDLRWPAPEAARRCRAGRRRPAVWRIEEDVIDGSVTVAVHDGGEDDRARRPAAVRRRDAADDGLGRRPGARRARCRRRLPLAGTRAGSQRRADAIEIRADGPPDQHARPTST